ncbi:hypothetical protein CXF96_05455 [Stenotrophomonas sp. Betaine-02u-21]|uniref:hypothetical protein n=1 Tax=unclassified Stenotrophomonas TaxID=196198 RepID=UPI000C3451B3|nr:MULTISPECIES: hypothetical protein [unclassified Stenotrophomonas]PKH70290.1 hypothetical protein CXF90_15460 [Stenotrophomonas sp. Betaine-02u-23]PKH75183.1 hypothetical protein CXF96_05455 [Stenotrophomonas sp. Betaine-02u-21]PKH97606.1 hypothetical protein CXG43_01885 [Stenotrophomonas sp. Bg11-02]
MNESRVSLEVRPVSVPVAEAGWYLAYGYGIKPLVLYAARGTTVWRVGMRQVPITQYAGPVPEQLG